MKSSPTRAAPHAVVKLTPPLARSRWAARSVIPPFLRDPSLYLLLIVLAALTVIGSEFASSLRQVTLRLGDQSMTLWTHQTTVQGVLTEAGFKLKTGDVIEPNLAAPLPSDGLIQVREATPVVIEADGDTIERPTQSTTVDAVLRENSILVKPYDKVFMDGRLVELASPLPRFVARAGLASRLAIPANAPAVARLSIQRAIPITVVEDGAPSVIYTTEPTLGQALSAAGILVYLGDQVTPDLAQATSAGRTIFVRRSQPASISVDNRIIRTRTQAKTVGDLLAQEGVTLAGKDYTSIALDEPVRANLAVNVVRIREVFETESEAIAYQTQWLPNPDLEIDQKIVAQQGIVGVKKRTIKTVYENGRQISRGIDREWIDRPPQNLIYNYGTKIVERPLTLPDGRTVTYWRVIRVLATSYSAATSGKNTDHPQYGITYTGLKAGKGIVAVDPRLIRLNSSLYVPGYGTAVAGDTGGRILGRRIDLGYAEDALVFWFDWVDVYVLSPVPARSQVNFNLPDLPKNQSTWLP